MVQLITFAAEIIIKFPTAASFDGWENCSATDGQDIETAAGGTSRRPPPATQVPRHAAKTAHGVVTDRLTARRRPPAGTRRRLPFGARFVSSDRTQPPHPPRSFSRSPSPLVTTPTLIGIKRKSIDPVIDEN